jgi:hypothetical protein
MFCKGKRQMGSKLWLGTRHTLWTIPSSATGKVARVRCCGYAMMSHRVEEED